ncbi:hypothetical protein EDD37DRAFT_433269 [Exophiala viscosa]|uniref:Zn(2)-C6 fungal-type domain-containing protein n=1 Tax=Exophiala viscosa TaxID=2486360 RepID=A0AAN6DVA6_9EURO|nr:hypothetical protein EDD36DRAFT_290044 [Exophiala viscosa]KAI1623677.1 hypothetical protein EDD37DRAFT_433269 [Exophiala viscosa]
MVAKATDDSKRPIESSTPSLEATRDSVVVVNSDSAQALEKQRKKRHAPKVRTGCKTCKKRRVKCDERKPLCYQCSRRGIACLGYEPVQTWIFELPGPTLEVEESQSSAQEASDSATSDDAKKSNLSAPTSLAPLVPFRSAAEARSFQYFECKTGPFLATAVAYPKPLLNTMLGSAWQCAASRDLLIAVAITDEFRSNNVEFLPGEGGIVSTANSTRYYATAMGLMAREQYPIPDLLIASILAWIYDLGHRRTEAARIHLNSALAIADTNTARPNSDECRPEDDDLIKTVIKPALDGNQNFHDSTSALASGWTDDTASGPTLKVPEKFSSMTKAVQSCRRCFDLLHAGLIPPKNAAEFGRGWLQSVRKYGAQGAVSPMQRWALYILYAALSTFIETLYLDLTGIAAQIRWNYIIGQMEKIFDAEHFPGFTEVLNLLIQVMAWSCEHEQPISRARRLIRRTEREHSRDEDSGSS